MKILRIWNGIFLAFLLLLSSCSIDSQIAKKFTQSPPPISILLFPADALYKYNHKGEEIPGFDSLSGAKQDSALYASSRFIRRIDDSIFLEYYMNSFIDELRKLKFTVYLPDAIDSVLYKQPQAYALNVAQVQVDEYNYPIEDEAEVYDTTYYKTFELNGIDFSAWYEISKMNTEKPLKTVLYATHTITDSFEGSFFTDPWTGDIKYRYSIDTLTLHDMYTLASALGWKHAGYLYDFFLNRYIAYHMPEGQSAYFYYHYDRRHNRLEPAAEGDQFEILSSVK